MNSNDFYILSHDLHDSVFHIPSSRIISLKKGSNINSFFRQLVLNETLLTADDFFELEKLIKNEFGFLKNNETTVGNLGEIDLQSIILPISGQCNLRCSYCFAQNKGDFGFGDINSQKAKEIIDYTFKNNNVEFACTFNFFGGEPLLNITTIEESIRYIKENYSDRKVNFSITTNGTILNKKILTLIKEYNIGVLLSYDGPLELGSHRTYKNGKHTNSRVLRNIELLKKEDVKFQLRATIPSDCNNMKDIYEYLESLNIPFAAVLAYKSRNTDESCIYDGKLDFFEEQYKILLDFYISRMKNKLPINCYSIKADVELLKRHETKNYSCSGGVNLFAITDNGNIFSCEHLAFHEKYKIGNIASGIDKEVLSKMQPLNVTQIAGCEKCWIKYLCAGGCFSEKILTNRYTKTLSEDECNLKKFYWHFILNLYIMSLKFTNWPQANPVCAM